MFRHAPTQTRVQILYTGSNITNVQVSASIKVITKKISKKSLVLTKTGHGCSNFQKSGIFGNLKVLSVQNCHRFLYPVIFEDFMAILTIKM